MLLHPNHYSLVTTRDMVEISKPLLETYGIHFFLYARIYDYGEVSGLITHENYQRHHFEKKYLVTPPMPQSLLNRKNFYYIFNPAELNGFNQTYDDFRNLFAIDHHLFMIERYDNYYELFLYGAPPNKTQIINEYLNNIDYFEKYKFYFREKAKKLIEETDKQRICIPKSMQSNFGGLNYQIPNCTVPSANVEVNQYPLKGQFEGIILTKREVETLKQITRCLTMKETAKVLNISPRTVETHLNNVKVKLGIQKKSDIIRILSEAHLF